MGEVSRTVDIIYIRTQVIFEVRPFDIADIGKNTYINSTGFFGEINNKRLLDFF